MNHAGRAACVWWQLVRFGFRLLYNEFAWTYDLVSWSVSLGHWRSWQRAVLPHLAAGDGGRVLELAHGTGNLQLDLADAGYWAIAIDLSPFMGRLARRKLRRARRIPRLIRASAMQIPLAAGVMDSVVSTFPTEFIVDPLTLGEVFRVLRPGGRLIVVPNGQLTLTHPIARFLEWLYRVTGQRGPWPVDPLAAFRRAGFEAQLIIESIPGSQVWIIIADRPPNLQPLPSRKAP